MMRTQFKYVFFDADDTLWENESYFREAEHKFALLLSAYAPEKDIVDMLMQKQEDNIPIYGYGSKTYLIGMLDAAAELCGEDFDSRIYRKTKQIIHDLAYHEFHLKEGIEDVLKALGKKYRLAVATKGDLPEQMNKYRESGLKKYFHHIEVMEKKSEEDYLETQEGKLLPVRHGIEGSEGWHLIRDLDEVQKEKGFPVYRKNTFASRKLAEDLYDINSKHPIKSIEIIGLCTDICVLMIKGFLPEVPIKVDSTCCAGVTAERHEAALKTMESCQISVIQEDQEEKT